MAPSRALRSLSVISWVISGFLLAALMVTLVLCLLNGAPWLLFAFEGLLVAASLTRTLRVHRSIARARSTAARNEQGPGPLGS